MEYGIYFNNNSANENILAAITELENIFFIENSSSDDEKNTSDNEEVEVSSNNSNDIENLEENFKEMRLNNFEFTENNDNYIEDIVYDDVKLKVKKFFSGKCSCSFKCFEKISYEQFLTHRKTSRFKYCFNSNLPICRTTYENYSEIHGLPSLGRNFSEITMPIVFLPTSYSYISVYRDYIQAYKNEYGTEARIIAESTFRKIWKLLIPSLQFMTPKSDLCETCELMKLEIQYITEHEKKLAITEKYLNHLEPSQILFKSFEGSAHIAYDWAQNVQIPYSPQQIGSIFFKSPRKVHLFGVCNTGNFPHTEQTNYIIDEAEMPDDGKQGKGVNCTLSLVRHAILKYNHGEKKLVVTCDNCVGQNKNNFSLFFYSWLIDCWLYEEIELNFMIPGHTKFICDSCFSLIKVLYRKSKVNTIDDIVSIIDRSTTVHLNTSQRYLNGEGFKYYNFKDYFQKYKKLPNIQKQHHFYFNSLHPGEVFYKDKLEDEYKKAIIRNFPFDSDILPSTISIRPLSLKRQEELHKEIAPYIDISFRNITCPKPKEHETV
ncbi:hypothetical protein GLOIN_2v1484099 [Rhizophagus clarus]|uniref:DUF7869 domain-containing protein n=1 Tax=Rhizophagus clarus TaxID=94130 RepID=A0A8H3M830_9GLOM|nr:hypothetical protein GLOIN_2v1484099 [Rhizophagus clarus]